MTFDKNGSHFELGLRADATYLSESARQNETMNFDVMRHVLIKLGFAKEFKAKPACPSDAYLGAQTSMRSQTSAVPQANASQPSMP